MQFFFQYTILYCCNLLNDICTVVHTDGSKTINEGTKSGIHCSRINRTQKHLEHKKEVGLDSVNAQARRLRVQMNSQIYFKDA